MLRPKEQQYRVASRELEKWAESDQSADEEEVIKNITAIAYAGQSLFVGDIKDHPHFHIYSWC